MITLILSNAFLITSQFLYSERETRFTVSLDHSEFITGSEEMMRSMDRFHVSTEEVFESLSNSSVKLDATLSGSLESQTRQLENYKGIVRSVEAAISGSGEQIEEAYMDIARTAQEAARTGATRLVFDVEGARVQVDLYKRIIDDFLATISTLSAGVKSGSVTTKEAATSIAKFGAAFVDILPSEFLDQLNRTRMSLRETTMTTDQAAKRIGELGSAMKEVAAKDVTFRFKVDPENIKQVRDVQTAIGQLADESKTSISSLSTFLQSLPQDFPPVANAFKSIATEAGNIEATSGAFAVVNTSLNKLRQTSDEITFSSIQAELERLSQTQAGQAVAKDLNRIIEVVREKTVIETFAESIRDISVDVTSIEDLRSAVSTLSNQFAQVPGTQKYISSLEQFIDTAEESKVPIDTVRKNIFDLSRTVSAGLKPEKALSDIESLTSTLGEQSPAISKVRDELRQLSTLKLETPEDINRFTASIENIKRKLDFTDTTKQASASVGKFTDSLAIVDTDPVISELDKLTDKYQFVRTTFQKELNVEGFAQTQEAIKGVIKEAEEVNNIRPVLSGLRDQIDNLPPALSGVAQGFTQVVATGHKLADIGSTGRQLLALMESLKTSGVTSFEGINNALNQLIRSEHLFADGLQPLKQSLKGVQEELLREADIRQFGEALVLAAKQPSASMTDLEGNVKGVLDAFAGWTRIEGVTDDVASLLNELGKTESVQKARQDLLGFGRTLTEGVGTEEYIEKLSDIGESLAGTGEDTSKFTSILNKFASANIKTAGDADKLNSEIKRTANNLESMGEETKAAQNINKLSESITKSKVDRFGKDITKLTDNLSLTSNSLVSFKDNLLKVGNRYEGMAPSIGNINNLIGDFDDIIKDLISAGLPQLAGRFQGIREEAQKRLGLAFVSEELEKVNSLLSTGDIEDAELSIRDLSSSTQLSANQFKDLRSNLDMLSASLGKQNVLVEASSKIKQIISNKSISSVEELREELKKARTEFENTKGLEEFNESLGDVIETSEEFKKIDHFRKALHGLTTIKTDDIDVIQSSLKGLGDEAKKDARSIEDLVEDLRKLGVSPSGLKSIEKAEESLRGIHGTARKKRVVDQYAKSVEKTADKLDKASTGAKKFTKSLGDINKNAGGMRKLFSGLDAQMSKLLIRFGVFGIVKNVFREVSQAIAGATREIYTLTKESAKLQDTSTAFRVLASQTTSAELALAQVRSAAGGVIDEFELMASATRAAIAGLPVERIDDFMRGARALGPLVGRDIPEAFDRLTSAAIKQERRLLDELGIVIRANDAYKEYARTHKTTVAALSATEKQMAFTEAIIASVNEKILRLGGNLDQAQRPFLRFESAWKDLRISMGDWLSEALAVPDVLSSLTRLMKDFSFSLADASKQSAILAASTLEAYESFKRYSDEFAGSVPRLVKEAQRRIEITEDQTSSIAAQYDAETRLAEIVKTLSTAFPSLAQALKVDVAGGLRAVAEESAKLRQTFQSLSVTRMAEAFQVSIKAYKEASASLSVVREELDLLTAARNKTIEKATPEEIASVDEAIKKYKEQAKAIRMVSLVMSAIPAQQAINLSSTEANIKASTRLTSAFMEEQVAMRSQTEIMEALIKSNIELENITAENFSNVFDTIDAYEDYKVTTADVTLDQFLMNKELETTVSSFVTFAETLGSATDSSEDFKKGIVDLSKEFDKIRAITGLTNEELEEHHELLRTIITDLADVPPATKEWESIFKQFETLTKTYNKFRTQFEPTEFLIDIKPSEKSKIELKRTKAEYKALFNLLATGIEFTGVPADETNKTVAAQQMLNELLEDQQRYIQQIATGETNLAKKTLESIDERLEVYKLDKTQVDELNILSNKQLEIRKQELSINKQIASEKVALTEESIANIKRETKNQIDAYKQIITKREALVSSLDSLDILSYELESRLNKQIAQDRIMLQKAEWSDEQKRLKDKIKSQIAFASTMSNIMNNLVGANKEAVIDMLADVSEMGTEAFKLDIKPGDELSPEKITEAFAKIKDIDIDIPGFKGLGEQTTAMVDMVLTTLSSMLTQVGDETTKVTEKTMSQMEDIMKEYLVALDAGVSEIAAVNNAFLSEEQSIEKERTKNAIASLKRQLSYEKSRVSFIKKANKDILSIEKSSNKATIASRVKALKIEFDALDEEVKKNNEVQQVVQDHAIAAHGQTSDINLENTREYLLKIRRATKTSQLLKIRDEYDIEELGEINKDRLRGEYANQFKSLLDKEIDVIENNIKKRQGLEEAGAINRINVARKETRQKIEELIKVAQAEGKPDEVKRLQELSIASQEIASNKITAIIANASRKRRMESLKLQKDVAGNEEKLARLTIDAQMDAYAETNQRLNDLAQVQKQKHLEDISRLLEATDVNKEELDKRSASLKEVLTLESVTKDNLANADVLREQLLAEAIRKIREKEFNEYQSIMSATSDVLGETSKIAFEINKNLIVSNAAEREKDLEHAKNIAVRKMRRETDVLEEQLKKELEIEADFERKRRALRTATDEELLANVKSHNSAVAESYLETFNIIIESFKAFTELMITDDAEMVEARKNTQVTFWRDQQTLIRKNSDKVIKSNQDLADKLLEIDMKSSERRKLVINSLLDVAQNAGKAVASAYSGDIAGTITSTIGMIQSINRIFDDASNRRKEALEHAKEEFKALKSEWRAAGAELGNAVGQAITDNLDVDWDELVRGFMRAAVASQLGSAFAEMFGPSMDMIKDSLAGAVGRGERWDKLVEDEVTGAQRFINQYEKVLLTQGKVTDEFLRDRFGTDVLEKIIEPYRRGVPIEKIASDVAKSKHGFQSLGKGLDDLNTTWTEMEPEAREIAQRFNSMLGIFEEAEENAGLRTLRAITEPQANQIIVLLGRQVDHLAMISSNTTTLVKNLGKKEEALPQPIELLAPQINSDIIPNKIQTINLAPQIINEVLFEPKIEPVVSFNPNIINEIDVPEINISPHIINEVNIPDINVIVRAGLDREIDLSQGTLARLTPAINYNLIPDKIEVTPIIDIEPQILLTPNIINKVEVEESMETHEISFAPKITSEVLFDPQIEPIISFNPNIINKVDVPEISISPKIITDISQISVVSPIDLSSRTITQLAQLTQITPIAPAINNNLILDKIQVEPIFNFEPQPQPLPILIDKGETPDIFLTPNIINDVDIPEINVAPPQMPFINLAPEIINKVLFKPNIINDVDIPEITNEVDLSQVRLVTPNIINRNEINIPDIDVSYIIDIPEVLIPESVDISSESIAQLAPAITTPQIQFVERITQPIIQKQPEYYPREEESRSVLSEHKEEINISININDRTVVSQDGMLVDAVLPLLMEEESKMKMRREKATGRRVFSRARV